MPGPPATHRFCSRLRSGCISQWRCGSGSMGSSNRTQLHTCPFPSPHAMTLRQPKATQAHLGLCACMCRRRRRSQQGRPTKVNRSASRCIVKSEAEQRITDMRAALHRGGIRSCIVAIAIRARAYKSLDAVLYWCHCAQCSSGLSIRQRHSGVFNCPGESRVLPAAGLTNPQLPHGA